MEREQQKIKRRIPQYYINHSPDNCTLDIYVTGVNVLLFIHFTFCADSALFTIEAMSTLSHSVHCGWFSCCFTRMEHDTDCFVHEWILSLSIWNVQLRLRVRHVTAENILYSYWDWVWVSLFGFSLTTAHICQVPDLCRKSFLTAEAVFSPGVHKVLGR